MTSKTIISIVLVTIIVVGLMYWQRDYLFGSDDNDLAGIGDACESSHACKSPLICTSDLICATHEGGKSWSHPGFPCGTDGFSCTPPLVCSDFFCKNDGTPGDLGDNCGHNTCTSPLECRLTCDGECAFTCENAP